MDQTIGGAAGHAEGRGLPARREPTGWASSRPRAERARQVADVLRQQITSGRFVSGALPAETVLGREFNASRNAVRDALSLLREEGLVIRRPGVGTLVATTKYGHPLDRLTGLGETLSEHGDVVNQIRIAEKVAELPPAIAQRLEVPTAAGGVYLERLRWLDGRPLSLDSTYLTADVGAAVLAADVAGQDVFSLIEQVTGKLLGRADVAIHAVNADAGTAALLEIPVGAAVFAIERCTRLSDGQPVDVESIRMRADRMTLHATLHRSHCAQAD